jgi:hypothetical protein
MNAQTRNYYQSLTDSGVLQEIVNYYSEVDCPFVSCWIVEDDLVKKHPSSNEGVDYHAVAKIIAYLAVQDKRDATEEEIGNAYNRFSYHVQNPTLIDALDSLYSWENAPIQELQIAAQMLKDYYGYTLDDYLYELELEMTHRHPLYY